ncbi:MAG: hypothetical protein K0Q79_1002 [Flavipsychrobacter sp.]|jgi:hypothetical protein|nr:hypothetical protein [Flavipsychrobacter sp.]
MTEPVSQRKNVVTNGDIVGGDKIVNNNLPTTTKLSRLFERLKAEYGDGNKVDNIIDDLKRFSEPRDIIGLEKKLQDGDRLDLLEDAAWLKQEYAKKLTHYQFFEPAQEIHAYLLSVVFEKFRNIVYPMMQTNRPNAEISKAISNEVIGPVMQIIQEHGCDDIMGLSHADVEGMIYYLTGLCHIKWTKV